MVRGGSLRAAPCSTQRAFSLGVLRLTRVLARRKLPSSMAPSLGLQHQRIKMFLEPSSSAFAFDSLSQGIDNLIYACYYKSKHRQIKWI